MENIQIISYRDLMYKLSAANKAQADASITGCKRAYAAATSRVTVLNAERLRRAALPYSYDYKLAKLVS